MDVIIRRLLAVVIVLLDLVLAPLFGRGELPLQTRGMLLIGTVVTMDDDDTVIPNGRVLVRGGRIVSVWSGPTPPLGVFVGRPVVVNTVRGGLIFPGLINLHDHPSANVLPVWPPPSSHEQPTLGRPEGTEPYANRYQWSSEPDGTEPDAPPEFLRAVRRPRGKVDNALGLTTEAVKYAELQSILGGETSLEGARNDIPATESYYHLLARNLDDDPVIQSEIGNVTESSFVPVASALKAEMTNGEVDAWLVHLAEGVRDGDRPPGDPDSSRAELRRIASLGLLNDALVVVHGVGLERVDYETMREALPVAPGRADGRGAKLVWSPLSNLLLYGRTAQVTDALAEDLTVALGTDWTPSGSRNLLGELKVADRVLHHPDHPAGDPATIGLAGESLDRTLVSMVTRNPARAVRLDDEIGTIEAGKAADLVVIRPPAVTPTPGSVASPYRSLIDATERDVQLVLVDGDPKAATPTVMQQLKPNDHELVQDVDGTFTAAVDVTNPAVDKGTQTVAQIVAALESGLASLDSDPELEDIELTPLFAEDDAFWFEVLGGSPPTSWPYTTSYPANANHVLAGGNPFATSEFRDRWWPEAG